MSTSRDDVRAVYVFISSETTVEDFLTMLQDHNLRVVRNHVHGVKGKQIFKCAVEDLNSAAKYHPQGSISHGQGANHAEACRNAINTALRKRTT